MISRSKVALMSAVMTVAAACAQEHPVRGHQLSLSAADQPNVSWITESDVKTSTITQRDGQSILRIHLKPDAAQRMSGYASANVGKSVRYVWDGKPVADLKIASAFGETFELPGPPR